MYRTLVVFVLFLVLVSTGHAQEVRIETSSVGSVNRAFRVAANDQGRIDWPVKRAGEIKPGTQVQLTFDPGNADVDLLTDKSYGKERLLETVRKLAGELGYPKGDFIRLSGEFGDSVDIELNDYLAHPQKHITTFSFDLARLAEALKKTDLPKPIVIGIRPQHSKLNKVTLAGKELTEITFFGPEQVKPGSQLAWRAEVHWSGWIAIVILPSLLLFALITPWLIRKKPEQPKEVPNPEEVQKAYDKSRPMVVMMLPMLLMPLLFLALSYGGGVTRAIESVPYLVSIENVNPRGMLLMPLLMVASFGGATLFQKWRSRQEPKPAPDPDEPPTWTKMAFLTGLLPMMLLMMVLSALLPLGINPLRSLPLSWRANASTWLPMAMMVVGFLPGIIASILAARKVRTTLKPWDEWYDRVQDIARQAGVRVKNVVVVQSPQANAYASLWGTVGLTSKLLREFTPEEITSVVAHEIGHHRDGHVKRSFWISLGVTIVLLGGWWGIRHWLEQGMPKSDERRIWLNSPMVVIFILPFLRSWIMGRGQREREFEADRFAVQVTGDPELVIRTLEKIHTLMGTPHRLKPSDEAIASHPSLVNRIARIRQEAEI